jgi:hypothetical protein
MCGLAVGYTVFSYNVALISLYSLFSRLKCSNMTSFKIYPYHGVELLYKHYIELRVRIVGRKSAF